MTGWSARDALAQAKAYRPADDHERRLKAMNVAQIEAYIAHGEAAARRPG